MKTKLRIYTGILFILIGVILFFVSHDIGVSVIILPLSVIVGAVCLLIGLTTNTGSIVLKPVKDPK